MLYKKIITYEHSQPYLLFKNTSSTDIIRDVNQKPRKPQELIPSSHGGELTLRSQATNPKHCAHFYPTMLPLQDPCYMDNEPH